MTIMQEFQDFIYPVTIIDAVAFLERERLRLGRVLVYQVVIISAARVLIGI